MTAFAASDLAAWTGGIWIPSAPEVVSGVNHDTRTIRPGEMYVALCGSRLDGHAFLEDAFRKGASCAMVNRGKEPPAIAGPCLEVGDTQQALELLASCYRQTLRARVIGVTGSAGKTSVKELISRTLAISGPTAKSPGNWNNCIGLPMSMLRMDAGDAYGVMELGTNHPGEIRMLSRMLAPEWGVITNIGPAHIGFFGSLEAIAGEKAELLRALPADGRAFLNCDGAHFDLLRRAAPCRVVTVSAGGSADYVGERRDNGTRRVSVTESATGEKREFALPGPGAHHIVNVLFAVAVARQCGMPWEKVQEGIFGFRPLPLRGESINVAGVEVVNDAYNANPSSMRASIRDFIEMPAVGVKWLVLGDMLELGEHGPAEHRDLGQFAGRGPWGGIILVGALSRFAGDGVLISGFPDDRVFRCSEASEAGRIMADNIARGDAALVKGSRGMRLEEAIAEFKRRRENNGQQNVDHQGFTQCAGCAGGTFVAGG